MTNAIAVQSVSKRVGAHTLFSELSFSIPQGAKVGIVGANGSGKSTLLRILAHEDDADSGEVLIDKAAQVAHVRQSADFFGATTVEEALIGPEGSRGHDYSESIFQHYLSRLDDYFSLPTLESEIEQLSGGEKKRLQLVSALCREPDILLLDEPTNHLDIQSREALDEWIRGSGQTWLIVTHDRWLLHTVADHILELNPRFAGGALLVDQDYRGFQERREEMFQELANQEQRLKSQARREVAWLRQGAKARSTKSKHRTQSAHALLDSLKKLKGTPQSKIDFGFDTSAKKSKELLEFQNVDFAYGTDQLVSQFSFSVQRGAAIGLLGANGQGKSTLLKLATGELTPNTGTVKVKPDLKIGVFSQVDPHVNSRETLRTFFAPDSDSVVYRDESIHVASWATRFGFSHEQLLQPLSSLSGGERARARIAELLLHPADLLLLDEPTNDLDISVLEVLEESLLAFEGAILLVSHDRYFLSRVCNQFIGVGSKGNWEPFAEVEQWLKSATHRVASSEGAESNAESTTASSTTVPAEKITAAPAQKPKPSGKKLSYLEQREYDSIEAVIHQAEAKVESLQAEVSTLALDDPRVTALYQDLAFAQQAVEQLYARWQALEKKQNG